MVGKRSVSYFTVQEKLKAIRRVHSGESKASIARDIGVPESTFRKWCRNEQKFFNLFKKSRPSRKYGSEETAQTSESTTLTNSSIANMKENKEGSSSNPESGKNWTELVRLGKTLGLYGPEVNPSDQDKVKILELLKRNCMIAQSCYGLMHQYQQNVQLIKTMINAPTNNAMTARGAKEVFKQLPDGNQASNDKVSNWLLNYHQEYCDDKEVECRCET